MCGRYNLTNNDASGGLLKRLGIDESPQTRLDIAPGARGQIVIETPEGRYLDDALWSLLIERKPEGSGYRPSPQYSTFNARAGSLASSPLWRERFRRQRCIVPATGFHEWTGTKGSKQCQHIVPVEGAIAFAGLFEYWDFGNEMVTSYTIVTLPPHPRFSHIHPKSVPLMLQPEDFDAWLSPDITDGQTFQHLLASHIPMALKVQPVRSPTHLESQGETETESETESETKSETKSEIIAADG